MAEHMALLSEDLGNQGLPPAVVSTGPSPTDILFLNFYKVVCTALPIHQMTISPLYMS